MKDKKAILQQQRRAARQHVVTDKHDHWGYEEMLFALAGDMLDELAPRPSQHVPGGATHDVVSRRFR